MNLGRKNNKIFYEIPHFTLIDYIIHVNYNHIFGGSHRFDSYLEANAYMDYVLYPTVIKYVKDDNDPSYQEKVALKNELEELKVKMFNVSGKQYETLITQLIKVQIKLDAKKYLKKVK